MSKSAKMLILCFSGVAIVIAAVLVGLSVLHNNAVKAPKEPRHTNSETIAAALSIGRLAPLPASASEIKTSGIDNIFSGTFTISFEAQREDIETFLKASTGLQGVVASPDKSAAEHAGYTFSCPDVSGGSYYFIPQDTDANYGMVAVDWNNNTVYIETSHS